MDWANSAILLPVAGLFAGIVLGYAARRNFFCTLSSLEQFWYANNSTGVRTWVLAAATAAAITQAMIAFGIIDITSSFYLRPYVGWLALAVGGLSFGFGMALVGTCGFGALVRLGGGSLKSLVAVIVMAITALSTQRGILGVGRTEFFDPLLIEFNFASDQSLPSLLSAALGYDVAYPVVLVAILLPLIWIFSDAEYRRDFKNQITGVAIGAVVAFGWYVTYTMSTVSFDLVQIESASFVTPLADTLVQFIMFTGVGPDYGVGLMVGTVIGASIAARSRNDVRWEACDDARELSRHFLGAALMGFGGVLALGCTIGQGVTAASALAVSAPITMLFIVIGARLGLAWLLEGSLSARLWR